MTIQNDFLQFAASATNIESQATYAADAARSAGETADTIASSARANKVWRQSAAISAMIAEFVVQQGGLPMVDNGSISTILANFIAALGTNSPLIGQMRGGFAQLTAASGTINFSADEIIVGSALGGYGYKLGSFSAALNLATTGAGGMDSGSAPTNSYVGIYAIYNPSNGSRWLLATSAAGSSPLPTIYAGTLPGGYTQSALVAVWPTNGAGLLQPGTQIDCYLNTVGGTFTLAAQNAVTSQSIANAVPANAKSISGILLASLVPGSSADIIQFTLYPSTSSIVYSATLQFTSAQAITDTIGFNAAILGTPQHIYYTAGVTGSGASGGYQLVVTGYTI